MAGPDEPVDERLVLGVEPLAQRAEIAFPLRFGAGAGDHRAHDRVGQDPVDGEADRRAAARLGVALDRLGHRQRFRPELRLHHAAVLAAGPGRRVGSRLGDVFAGEHAPGQRAVRHDAQAVVGAGGQVLDLRHAVHGVVVRLADDRPRHVEEPAEADDLRDPEGAEVAHPPVPELALPDEVAQGLDRLVERERRVVEMQEVDVHVVQLEARETLVHRPREPEPAEPAPVRTMGRQARAPLGRDDPAIAVGPDCPPDDPLRLASGIGVGRVEEVDAGLGRASHDPQRLGLAGLVSEHHGAEAQDGHLDAARAEAAVLHGRAAQKTGSVPSGSSRHFLLIASSSPLFLMV
jgi:hypothetical protein